MKAVVCSTYGSPEVLSIKELDIPTLKDNEVLVKVYATTVNRTDCHLLSGTPFIMRLFAGLFKPRLAVTGTDFAGQIEAAGKNVTSFKVGDKVMGFEFMGLQSHAQYLSISETKTIVTIPGNLTYDEAVACLEGALYAYGGISNVNPTAGQKALVNGATGAIGSSLVQILKFYGVYITAVCNQESSELVKSLGADKVINYKSEDFTKDSEQYDFVFDAAGKSTFSRCKPLLKKKGIYLPSDKLINFILALVTPLFGRKKVVFPPPKNMKVNLLFIKELIEKGIFKPVIDRKYPIDKIAEAFS